MASEQRNGLERRERDVSGPTSDGTVRLDLSRESLCETDGLNEEKSHPDRKSAFERIRELGHNIRGIGAAAISAVSSFFSKDTSDEQPSEQARRALDASEQSLGAAERFNERSDRQGESLDRQMDLMEFGREIQRELERGYERVR